MILADVVLMLILVKVAMGSKSPWLCAFLMAFDRLGWGFFTNTPMTIVLVQVGVALVLSYLYYWVLINKLEHASGFWLLAVSGALLISVLTVFSSTVIALPVLSAGRRAVNTPTGREKDCLNVTQQFGQALMTRDYYTAYTLTAGHLRDRMDYTLFAQQCGEERNSLGDVLKVEAQVVSTDPKTYNKGNYGRFIDIDPKDFQAETLATLAQEMDGQYIVRCHEYVLALVDEGGQIRVANYYSKECD